MDVGCLHTLSPVQYSIRALQEQQVSFEAIWILNNWLFLCCSPSWEHYLKPAWVFLLKIQFYEMIGVQHEGYKTAQVEVIPFFFFCQDFPSLSRFCFYILVTWLCVGNREAAWNLKSHWKTGVGRQPQGLCWFIYCEGGFLSASPTLQAPDTNLPLQPIVAELQMS